MFPYPDVEKDEEANFPDETLIEDIIGVYKNVTVVIATGLDVPENLNYVQTLGPLLPKELEYKQCDDYEEIKYYIDQQLAD